MLNSNPPSQVSPHASAPTSDPDDSTPEESVEVVLNAEGSTKVINDGSIPDQNVFRHPQLMRPRGAPQMRVAPRGGPPPHPRHAAAVHPMYYGSGSWGYGPYRHGLPPPSGHHPHHPHHTPYPVPHYPTSSGSFDEQSGGYHHQHQTPHHYSPHVQYPGPRFPSAGEEVNVISPNHKTDPHQPQQPPPHHNAASPARPRPPYYYPPASPVSRPDQVPPRLRSYAMRRNERSYHRRPEYDWNQQYGAPPGTPGKDQQGAVHPPLVADSFDSGNHSSSQQQLQQQQQSMHIDPTKSGVVPSPKPSHNHHHNLPLTPTADPHVQFYGGGGSWESFDSAVQHIDDRQNGNMFPPDSPYSPYTPFSPLYAADSFPSPYHPGAYGHPPPVFSYSHDETNTHEERMLRDYHPDHDKYAVHSNNSVIQRHRKSTVTGAGANANSMLLPKAAQEVDFDVVDPPLEPATPESPTAICESMGEVNGYDVLCGRGGGTNSQIGNRRFRQLVQEFQPIYLVAKRKEKPLLARSIVLIIRKRGGRFLKKDDDNGELSEVGDTKAEAKTSQALREGLDVRATRSSLSKKKKKSTPKLENSPVTSTTKSSCSEPTTPQQAMSSPVYSHPMNTSSMHSKRAESPPRLPKLQGDSEPPKVGLVHPHSPDHAEIRKRRRVRTTSERFVGDFLPPRADITRPEDDDGVVEDGNLTPIRRNNSTRDDSSENMDCSSAVGCAGIALDLVTGAAAGSFCLGPKGWRR
jgi:hypothetical protein